MLYGWCSCRQSPFSYKASGTGLNNFENISSYYFMKNNQICYTKAIEDYEVLKVKATDFVNEVKPLIEKYLRTCQYIKFRLEWISIRNEF